jgi:hypothetical protein
MSRVVATLKDGLEAWRTRSVADLDVIYVYLGPRERHPAGSTGAHQTPRAEFRGTLPRKSIGPKSNFVARHEIRVGRRDDFGGSEASPLPACIRRRGQIRV